MNNKPRKTPQPPDVVESIKPSRLYRRRDQDKKRAGKRRDERDE